jgi:glycine cleavage system aminomethyltransferase T
VNEDFRDLLAALLAEGARFLVVGAHALAAHGIPRATGDLGVWIAADADDAQRVHRALIRFGAPMVAMGLAADDLTRAEQVLQIGLPPRHIDVLTSITGVDFDEAWPDRVSHDMDGVMIPILGRATLVKNKRATGRAKDLADLEALGEDARA